MLCKTVYYQFTRDVISHVLVLARTERTECFDKDGKNYVHQGKISRSYNNQRTWCSFFLHYVCKEDIVITPSSVSYFEVTCWGIHISFLEELHIRPVTLCPSIINDIPIGDLLTGIRSPALIRITSSCDLKVS
jgi:hypothetical protein